MKNHHAIAFSAMLFLMLQGCSAARSADNVTPENQPSVTSSASDNSPAFVVSILGDSEIKLSLIREYMAELSEDQETHGGQFTTSPIEVKKQLDNPWLPESASVFPGDFVLIEHFPNMENAQGYLSDVADEYSTWGESFRDEIRFLAVVAPNPGPKQFPIIGSVPLREGDAFILLNAASFLPPEESQPLISQYFQTAGPIVSGAGTQFLASLANVAPITGEFPHQIMFLSEWASEEAFEIVHNNSEWQTVAPYRNQVMTSFTEAKGVIVEIDRALDID